MPTIAITSGGWGSILLFSSVREANFHPVIQPGLDAVMGRAEDLQLLYSQLEWTRLMRMAGVRDDMIEDALPHLRGHEERMARRGTCQRIWDGLLARAVDPPRDYNSVCAMVAIDRAGKKEMKMSIENTESVAEAAENDAADEKEKTNFGPALHPDTVITLAADDKGVKYGPENSPYRPGTGRHQRLVALSDGMTVGQATKDGQMSSGQLRAIAKRGHITLTPPAAAEA